MTGFSIGLGEGVCVSVCRCKAMKCGGLSWEAAASRLSFFSISLFFILHSFVPATVLWLSDANPSYVRWRHNPAVDVPRLCSVYSVCVETPIDIFTIQSQLSSLSPPLARLFLCLEAALKRLNERTRVLANISVPLMSTVLPHSYRGRHGRVVCHQVETLFAEG